MSSADVAEETDDVEAVKSVEDASYPTTASRELSHTKPSFAADADRGPGERAFYAFGKNVVGKRPWVVLLRVHPAVLLPAVFDYHRVRPVLRRRDLSWAARFRGRRKRQLSRS